MMLLLTTLLVTIFVLIYYKIIKPLSYWEERGVAHEKPLPIIGNSSSFIFRTKPTFEYAENLYKRYSNERYFGIHQVNKPALCIRDVELIKKITIKNFDQFMDHNNILADDDEPLMGKNLGNLKGQRWRDMRSTLSPSFTSSKMRDIFKLISKCGEEFTEYFQKLDKSCVELEMKDIFSRFTNDVIATVAFGVKCDSLREKNNEFFRMGKAATAFPTFTFVLFTIMNSIPLLRKFVKITMLPANAGLFFLNMIKETVRKRETEGLVRSDMIQLLVNARKGVFEHDEPDLAKHNLSPIQKSIVNRKMELTDEEITAQALIFFFGGFDTSSTIMSLMSYELALNQDVQKKLQNEIDDTLSECNGIITYEALHKMKYMDMVVSETLRKWPPGFQMDRKCVEDFVIEPEKPHEKPLLVEKDTMILINVVGIHRDEQYFENPYKFDPERFSEVNKLKIKPGSYIPFGSGPRSCIGKYLVPKAFNDFLPLGSRFALMENKIVIFYLLSKFNIVTTNKTPIPLNLANGTFNISPKKGFWLGLEQRKSTV